MTNDVIKHVRTKMTFTEKEKAATQLLKGLHTEEWNFAKIYREIGDNMGKPYHKVTHQKLKSAMFEILVAMYESEETW